MHPGGPRLDAATAIIAATLGHWRPKVAASIAVVPLRWATGGRLPAACPACCLRPQVTWSLQLSPLAMGPAPALGG